jgi:hypothetical protein
VSTGVSFPVQNRKLTKLVLDMDSSVSECYGHQEGIACNGYLAGLCYHPLFLFNQFGDLERVHAPTRQSPQRQVRATTIIITAFVPVRIVAEDQPASSTPIEIL